MFQDDRAMDGINLGVRAARSKSRGAVQCGSMDCRAWTHHGHIYSFQSMYLGLTSSTKNVLFRGCGLK